jgi:hypothetical protein
VILVLSNPILDSIILLDRLLVFNQYLKVFVSHAMSVGGIEVTFRFEMESTEHEESPSSDMLDRDNNAGTVT